MGELSRDIRIPLSSLLVYSLFAAAKQMPGGKKLMSGFNLKTEESTTNWSKLVIANSFPPKFKKVNLANFISLK